MGFGCYFMSSCAWASYGRACGCRCPSVAPRLIPPPLPPWPSLGRCAPPEKIAISMMYPEPPPPSASEKHITALSMEPGDVLLVDNYRALHGRDVFQGDRFHAVTWFTWDRNEEWRGNERRIVEKNAFNQAINKMMDWLPKDFVSDQS